MAESREKNKGGRPTIYKPEYCERAIKYMRNGASITEVAYLLNITRSTLYEWIDLHEEFADALKHGRYTAKGWWMVQGRRNIKNKEFNSTLFYMNMKNRFHWYDNHDKKDKPDKKNAAEALKDLE